MTNETKNQLGEIIANEDELRKLDGEINRRIADHFIIGLAVEGNEIDPREGQAEMARIESEVDTLRDSPLGAIWHDTYQQILDNDHRNQQKAT